ncbi:MAG: energy transducer TonB [Labilithrix sp.]|nr:energy transducer TonB [Labilithrix sp.]
MLPGSAALHVLVVAALPSSARMPASLPPMVIEMAEPPPPPAPAPHALAPPREELAAAPSPRPSPIRAAAPSVARVASERPAADVAAAADAPVDFTSALMSSDGPGLALGGGGGGAPAAARPSVASAAPVRAPPIRPRLVPARDLSRRPRAPGLDTALERHYPADARRSGISGKAVLRVIILPDGRVEKITRVEESRGGFGEACERTVREARWEPPIDREGLPVGTEITYTCRFEIRG